MNETPTISESRWRRYLNAHRTVTRKLASLRKAGGDANDLGRVLHRVQRHRLYLAQFPTFNECVLQEWQMPAGLADALITVGRALSKEEAQAAGVVPLPVLRELREMLPPEAQGPFDDFQKDLTIGKGAQERVLRAGKEVQAAGHGAKNAQAVIDRLLMDEEMRRKERETEREAQSKQLHRKPFQAVPWVVEPAQGAEVKQVQGAAVVRDAMRRAAPQMKRGLDGLHELRRAVTGAAFTFTGPEPQQFLEHLFGLYEKLPEFMGEMYRHLPPEDQEKWRERLAACGAMEKAADVPVAARPDKIRKCGKQWPGTLLLLITLGLCVPRLLDRERFVMERDPAPARHGECHGTCAACRPMSHTPSHHIYARRRPEEDPAQGALLAPDDLSGPGRTCCRRPRSAVVRQGRTVGIFRLRAAVQGRSAGFLPS